MHKLLRHIGFCFVLLTAIVYSTSDASAFFVKFDLGKTPSKLTNAIQNIKAKAEEIMDGIQNSQFGKFVGKGIEKIKEAKGFISGIKDKVMNVYGKVQKVIQSPAGQMAIISTNIAKLEVQKSKVKEQNQSDVKAIEDEIEILKTEAEADIEALRNNIKVLETRGDTSGVEKINSDIELVEAQLAKDVEEQKVKLAEVNENYKAQLSNLDTELKGLTTQLATMAAAIAKEEASKGLSKVKKKANETIKDTVSKLSSNTQVVSVKEEFNIRKARIKQMQESATGAITKTAELRNKMVVDKDNIDAHSDSAETQPGESEASNALGETLANQIKVMRDLVSVLIEDLKTKTAKDVNNIKGVTLKEVSENFNLCDYADPEKKGYVSENKNKNKNKNKNNTSDSKIGSNDNSKEEADDSNGWGGMF